MKSARSWMSPLLLGGMVLSALPAHAADCQRVTGRESVATGSACESVVGYCYEAAIDAGRGLDGTVRFVAESLTPGPATQASSMTYAGTVTITTARGTLSGHSLVIADAAPATPEGYAYVRVDTFEGGTGTYEGMTGGLFSVGTQQQLQAGKLLVAGQLCQSE